MNGRPALWNLIRDIGIWVLGFFILVHETLAQEPREILVGAALVLLGVPVYLHLRHAEKALNGAGNDDG